MATDDYKDFLVKIKALEAEKQVGPPPRLRANLPAPHPAPICARVVDNTHAIMIISFS